MSDIDTAVVDSLKVLDPKRPIREADIGPRARHVRFVPGTGILRLFGLDLIHLSAAIVRRSEIGSLICVAGGAPGTTREQWFVRSVCQLCSVARVMLECVLEPD